MKYTLRFIFNQALQSQFIITTNKDEFLNSELVKINYSANTFENCINITPSGLLEEQGIKEFVPPCKTTNNKIVLFFNSDIELGYDIFSGAFYFISRYEEWQKFVKDNHGRFEIRSSILYKLSALKIPVVDCWIKEFRELILSKFPGVKLNSRGFKFISTIDVDNVYAFKAKPLVRNIGGMCRDFVYGKLQMVASRIGTVFFGRKDPFDFYDHQIQISNKYQVPLIYFFLYRNNTKYDRTLDPNNAAFKKLLKNLKSNSIVFGLHPSYFTFTETGLLTYEKKLLEQNSNSVISLSRQHYLRFDIKTTPKQLLNSGIKFDFTMGFANAAGFRAGTSLPFYYYDFDSEIELEIMAVPFAVMDGAYYIYSKTSLQEVQDDIIALARTLKKVNGLLITVFHERSFSNELYPDWNKLYSELHDKINE